MLSFISLFSNDATAQTNLAIKATHSLRYVYPPSNQGGTHITQNNYFVKSIDGFDSFLALIELQCGPSAEHSVGKILNRETTIEIEGTIAGTAIQKQTLNSLQDLLNLLAKHNINTTNHAARLR